MRFGRTVGVTAVAALVALGAAAPAPAQRVPGTAVARLVTSEGAPAGRVALVSLADIFEAEAGGEEVIGGGGGGALTGRLPAGIDDAVVVVAHVRGVPSGFHGFHIHETGSCARPSFTSAVATSTRRAQTTRTTPATCRSST